MGLTSFLFLPLLAAHIGAGTVAMGSGATALVTRKGSATLHARAGRWFTISMLFMAASAAVLTLWDPDPLSMFTGILTCYLVATSWMAARGRGLRRYEWSAIPVALICALALGFFGRVAMGSIDGEVGGYPPPPFFVFGGLALLAVVSDLNVLLRANVNMRQRISRHLWRMCVAFFLAATSLFLGQQDDVFFFMAGSPLLFIPSLAILSSMVFWLLRARFAKQWLRPILPVFQRR